MTATLSAPGSQPVSNLLGDSLQAELAQLALVNKELLGRRARATKAEKIEPLDFQAELAQLAAVNEGLLANRRAAKAVLPPPVREAAPAAKPAPTAMSLEEENAALRTRIHQLEEQLRAAQPSGEGLKRQQEYEALLDEKTEVIRMLHEKIQVLQQGSGPGSAEVEHALRELEDERRRAKEDEKALEEQMRTMETALARERADLARQRNDVQRQEAEVERALGQSGCDPVLRDKLMSMQRRPGSRVEFTRPAEATEEAAEPTTKKTGLFRRLFG